MVLVGDDGATLVLSDAPPRLGGEAAVYDAVGPLGPCVVKVAWRSGEGGAWLDRERELLASLGEDPRTAPLVPAVLHAGRWEGRPFVALERFPATLLDLVASRPPLEDRLRVAARVAEVCERLRSARPELVHRDLKPSNLLLDGDRVVVTDLGIARDLALGATTTGALLTPDYAPPEQSLPRRRAEPSWDTFGLAATLYHVVVGEPAGAPGPNAWRLTPRGVRLRAGQDDGSGEAWDYLDLASAEALSRADRARLDALVTGPLRRALEAAMAPDPRRRRGTPATLRDAVLRSRPARPRTARRAAPVVVGGLGVALVAAVLARPEALPAYPMVAIEGGVAEGPDGPVPVSAFLLGAHEVDQALWTAVTGATLASKRQRVDGSLGPPCATFHDLSLVGPDLPMVCVDFVDAVRFADALSLRGGLRPAHRVARGPDGDWSVERVPGADGFRLPTLAEWRLAIGPRPGEVTLENGADLAYRRAIPSAVVDEVEDGFALAAPVAGLAPNPRGVVHGYGNVNEWLWDPAGAGRRWVGGGSWGSVASIQPAPHAAAASAGYRYVTLGLRLARDLP